MTDLGFFAAPRMTLVLDILQFVHFLRSIQFAQSIQFSSEPSAGFDVAGCCQVSPFRQSRALAGGVSCSGKSASDGPRCNTSRRIASKRSKPAAASIGCFQRTMLSSESPAARSRSEHDALVRARHQAVDPQPAVRGVLEGDLDRPIFRQAGRQVADHGPPDGRTFLRHGDFRPRALA